MTPRGTRVPAWQSGSQDGPADVRQPCAWSQDWAGPRNPWLRRGCRHRAVPRRAAGVPVRSGRAREPATAPGGGRRHLRLAGVVPLLRRRQRVCRGRGLLPRLSGRRRRVLVRRGGRPRDRCLVDPQPRHRDRVRSVADDGRGGRPAVYRDGLAAHPRGGRRGRRPGGIHRGVRHHEQPRGRPPLRRAHHRDGSARLHPRARRRTRGVRGAGRRVRAGHHPARRHLRRHRGRAHSRRGGGTSSTRWGPRKRASS